MFIMRCIRWIRDVGRMSRVCIRGRLIESSVWGGEWVIGNAGARDGSHQCGDYWEGAFGGFWEVL